MNTQTILYIILIACYLVVSFVLWQTVKSKNSIIADLKILLEGTDIKRLVEYYKAVDELKEKAILSQANIQLDNSIKKFASEIQVNYDEMATFLSEFIIVLPKNERLGFVRRHLTHCEDMFQEALNAPENPDYENDENEPPQ